MSGGYRMLLETIRDALDVPPGDPVLDGRVHAVLGCLRNALDCAVSDADLAIVAGILRDQLDVVP